MSASDYRDDPEYAADMAADWARRDGRTRETHPDRPHTPDPLNGDPVTLLNMRTIDLGALNSATKYPSIPTYHALDPSNGRLLPDTVPFTGKVILTEKVDGTNARIIQFPGGDWIIGSREDLLHARGDLVHNPGLGIVDALRDLADQLTPPNTGVRVLFLEVYGGQIGGAARQYTGSRTVGHRLFDVVVVDGSVLEWPREKVASWREHGGQQFHSEGDLTAFAAQEHVPVTPLLGVVPAADLPSSIADMHEFLGGRLPETRVALDGGAGGRPEGIVLRQADRGVIAKARFQDYRRTLDPAKGKNPKRSRSGPTTV